MIFVIGGVFATVNYVKYKNYKKINDQAKKILTEIEKENLRHEKLQAQIKSYDSDEYVEKTAREKLGLIKSDEIVFYQDEDI